MIHIANYIDLDKKQWKAPGKFIRITDADMGLLEWAVIYTLRERPDLHPDIADGLDLLLVQMGKINQHKSA